MLNTVLDQGTASLVKWLVGDFSDRVQALPGEIGVMLPDGWDASFAAFVYRWAPRADGEVLARRLFAGLRELDETRASVIVCQVTEMGGIGEAARSVE
jgi:L-threonylcarbamoyladenylate synthase